MRWLGFSLLFIVTTLLTVVLGFPADRAWPRIQPHLPSLRIAYPEGSIWCGTTKSLTYQGITLTDASWHVQLTSLITGNPALTVEGKFNGQPQKAEIHLNQDKSFDLRQSDIKINLNTLILALPLALRPGGQLEIHLEQARANPDLSLDSISGVATWKSALLGRDKLGNYQLDLKTENSIILGSLKTLPNSPVGANGRITLKPDGQYILDLTLSISKDTPDSLKRNLGMLGQFDASGRLPVHFQGNLSQLQGMISL
ncbi:MAG: type II secretion system protein N [Gammaproteobacteria bacterium]|nr:MAG: type II secretion system protein N [Gammaproteobacteria bacterium]